MPIFSLGLAAFRASAHFTSLSNEGTEVWITTMSKSFAWSVTIFRVMSAGGASISVLTRMVVTASGTPRRVSCWTP